MNQSTLIHLKKRHSVFVLTFCLLISLVQLWVLPRAQAAQLTNRSLQINNSAASGVGDYLATFDIATIGVLGSISLQFCSNDPIPNTPCTAPNGFDASSAVLSSQSGPGGFSISNSSTANNLILSRVPLPALAGSAQFHFTNVTNPSSTGSYYVRVLTYASNDASGPFTDYGGIAYEISQNATITATVPPYLTFCTGVTIPTYNCFSASGDYIDLGELSSSRAKSGSSQMLVTTNAAGGYSITVNGSTMSSGANSIDPLTTNDVSRPGRSQFGLNLRANAAPPVGKNPDGPGSATPTPNYNQPNSYRFVSGEVIVSYPAPDNIKKFTASYLVNIPATQPPGIYVATLTYICLGDF